jgi:hypothetical protein
MTTKPSQASSSQYPSVWSDAIAISGVAPATAN